jgi:hypothetical protein
VRVYFVGPPGGSFDTFTEQMRGKRVLYSFATCRGLQVPETVSGYCLDSGAFTAWKQGCAVNIDRLTEWYECHDTADFKLTLDVIGGSEADQRANLRILESNGQDVVPVFHGPDLESWKFFDEMCERYPLVAVSSVLPKNTCSAVGEWLHKVFRRVCDKETGKPRVRIHGLRMCVRMGEFPFDSVDGSAWVTAAKNGRMPTGNGTRQTAAPPGTSRLELQDRWIQSWTLAHKCSAYKGEEL